ncbi:hypothetical protein, partial [Escherichia coli]|uniref:hypothetical protein n=1 Tax=Escherichia coli TaxID=562 RepID=UPI001E46FF48
SDGNGSHASTLESPSYTKSVSWQHYPIYAKIVQSINKISAKLDETLFLMWIKFKRNVFIFTMIY